jgi:hypothetical protein
VESSCEFCIEPSGSVKYWEVLKWVHNWCQLLSTGHKDNKPSNLYPWNSCLLATITSEVVTFRAYASFSTRLTFFKCILIVMFCDSVQHCLQFCLKRFNCVKMADFQFYLQLGNKKKVGWVGDDKSCYSWSQIPS